MLVVIDADPIVYRCGFASERTSWHLVYEDDKCEVDEIEFSPTDEQSAGDQMRAWLERNPNITVLDKSRVVKPDPISYALRATNVQIDSIMDECTVHYKQPCQMVMYISGSGGSYRDKIATVRPYKGNRDPSHKPYHYHAIRDYLRTYYNSYVTSGIEADDAVSIFAHHYYETGGDSLVIATIDKDLDQIPGLHYNYMNKVHYAITETEAERWFIYQILAGDITDNIVGVWKCGAKCAEATLARIRLIEVGKQLKKGRSRTAVLDRQQSKSSNVATSAASDASVLSEHGQLRVSGDTVRGTSAASDRADDSNAGTERSELRRLHADPTDSVGSVRGASSDPVSGAAGHGAAGHGAVADSEAANAKSAGGGPNRSDGVESASRARIEQYNGSSVQRAPAWWPTVVRAYAESRSRSGCPYADRDPEAIAIEMAQLVKLQTYPGQLWHPHGDLVVPGFGEENFDG